MGEDRSREPLAAGRLVTPVEDVARLTGVRVEDLADLVEKHALAGGLTRHGKAWGLFSDELPTREQLLALGAVSVDAGAQVASAAEQRASALAAGDAERLLGLLHEDFRWTTHTGETYDRSEYVRRNTEEQTVVPSTDLSDAEVVVVGDTAVLYAQATDAVFYKDNTSETFRMPMTLVWVRLDDHWMCLAGHAGPRRS